MRFALRTCRLVVCLFCLLTLPVSASLFAQEPAPMMIWAEKNYGSWENPLHTEVSINGKLVNIFSSDTFEPIDQYLKEGWNTITLTTRPQEPASKENELIFRIGPMQPHPNDSQTMVMQPVLWQFRNGTDWAFSNGTFSHPLGPDVKEVTLNYQLYYAGLKLESQDMKAGDFVLQGRPNYGSWNSPVTAAVYVNGTPLNSFLVEPRQIIVTSLLQPGKNEIKLVSTRVKNAIKDNDILFMVAGPAEWNVTQKQYLIKPLVEFKAKQGWNQDSSSGQLINPANPESETIERVISFVLKQ